MVEKKIKLTKEDLNRAISRGGALSNKQFQVLGYDGVFRGWRKKLVGRCFSPWRIEEFISLKDKHYKPKPKPKKLSERSLKPIIVEDDTREGYDSKQWNELRKQIYRRDGFKCRSCGKGIRSNIKLNAHHLLYDKDKPLWDVPEYYLVTLCDKCHKAEHSKDLWHPKKHF